MSVNISPRVREVLQIITSEGPIKRSIINHKIVGYCAYYSIAYLVRVGIVHTSLADDPVCSLVSREFADIKNVCRHIKEYRQQKRIQRIGPILTTAPMLDAIVTSLASTGANQTEIYLY